MENTEIIQKARAKAEMWLNDAYDKATRTEVERLLNASDPTELIDSFTTIWNSVPVGYAELWVWGATG